MTQHLSQGDWLRTLASYVAIAESRIRPEQTDTPRLKRELKEIRELLVLTADRAELKPKDKPFWEEGLQV